MHGCTVERLLATEEDVEYHSNRPDICLRTIILPVVVIENLRSDVGWRAARAIQLLACCELCGQTEISKLDIALLVKQDVIRLYVSMYNSILVTEVNSLQNLSKDPLRLLLRQPSIIGTTFEDVIQPRGGILHDHMGCPASANDIVNLHDVLVLQTAMVLDLVAQILFPHPTLSNDFHGDFLTCSTVRPEPDIGKRSSAKDRAQPVAANMLLLFGSLVAQPKALETCHPQGHLLRPMPQLPQELPLLSLQALPEAYLTPPPNAGALITT
mmetsp:Transcript_39519/g.92956  ORF Transcript_39519/g.92956 Transcript_39519/m.92956 type:complete len:269 (+) Transcript_39519:530-1336(+)